MNDLPNPLTPADCDLRDFPFMPLDVVRLRDSDLSVHATGEEFRSAVLLWCASWHQMPAASLPDDDRSLAQLAGFGRVVSEWQKVREGALRGWMKCSDGRLYHPVVAEKARDGWTAKLKQRFKTECARIKKHCQRHEVPYVEPDFDEWVAAGCPQGQTANVPGTPPKRPKDNGAASQGQTGNVPGDEPNAGAGQTTGVPGEIDSKGQGEGQGEGQLTDSVIGSGASNGIAREDDDLVPRDHAEWIRYFAERHGVEIDHTNVHQRTKAFPLFAAWTNAGITRRRMDDACRKAQSEAKASIAFLPAYVDRVLATLDAPPQQPRLTPEERRRAISKANGDAWLAETPESDPNVIDMEH
ncbi:DUF1376 domain-containing protein [Burkholderia thailandensis]|uniref:DUF1376 domain-containing protein n=1 Tax=Burkholderia thailandensis TaxID=57975 RepID=UPI0013789B0D|nr:DUF1376 domain-containing protein [Burkholderia thailandensis]NBD02158.1 DUF1376 domain-containing protein [Burkholderia thailandensis]